MQPISDGSNSMTVCQPMVMMLVSPFQAELTSTIGPGSRNRRICDTGKSFFVKALIALSGCGVDELSDRRDVLGRRHAELMPDCSITHRQHRSGALQGSS